MPDTHENNTDGGSADKPATTVQNTMALAVAGEGIEVADSMIGALAAGSVTANDSLILLAAVGALDGDARVVLDTKAALALGAGLGVVLVVAGRLLGRRREETK